MSNALTRVSRVAAAVAVAGAVAAATASAMAISSSAPGKAAAPSARSAGPLKIAFMHNGPITDGGWSEAISLGRVALQKQLGGKIQTTYTTNIPFGPDITRIAEQYVKQGYNVVVDGVCGGCNEFRQLAPKYPKVTFLMADGSPPFKRNEAALFPKYWQSAYLIGVTAGLLTKSNKIGTVAAYNIPLIDSIVNSYALGCQSVNPKCEVLMSVQNSWLLPAKTAQLANSLVDQGADFVWSYLDDSTTARVADQRGAWTGGAYLDQLQFAPKTYVTGQVFNWGSMLGPVVQSILKGKFKAGLYLSNLGQGVDVGKVWGPKVPASVKAKVAALKTKLQKGWSPFVGPLYDQKGKLKLQKGQKLDDLTLYYKWNWLVKGVK